MALKIFLTVVALVLLFFIINLAFHFRGRTKVLTELLQEFKDIPILNIVTCHIFYNNELNRITKTELNNFFNNLSLIKENDKFKDLEKFTHLAYILGYSTSPPPVILELKSQYFIPPDFLKSYNNADEFLKNFNNFNEEAIQIEKVVAGKTIISHEPEIYGMLLNKSPTIGVRGVSEIVDYFYSTYDKKYEEFSKDTLRKVFREKLEELSKVYLNFINSGETIPFSWFMELKNEVNE